MKPLARRGRCLRVSCGSRGLRSAAGAAGACPSTPTTWCGAPPSRAPGNALPAATCLPAAARRAGVGVAHLLAQGGGRGFVRRTAGGTPQDGGRGKAGPRGRPAGALRCCCAGEGAAALLSCCAAQPQLGGGVPAGAEARWSGSDAARALGLPVARTRRARAARGPAPGAGAACRLLRPQRPLPMMLMCRHRVSRACGSRPRPPPCCCHLPVRAAGCWAARCTRARTSCASSRGRRAPAASKKGPAAR